MESGNEIGAHFRIVEVRGVQFGIYLARKGNAKQKRSQVQVWLDPVTGLQ